jgi:hypothetical protein
LQEEVLADYTYTIQAGGEKSIVHYRSKAVPLAGED